ncbi:BnaC02g23920D [Brassica napus]|uniref:BnaC02g23920D protein n=1 Tax=Brassica napus TaxID=3708 RepID=A0A078G4X3_BRANA|nr:BnaC02g23920D [Brassica napus]
MEVGSGSSRRSQNSGRRLCFCGLPATVAQAWTDKNPGRRFYGCPRYKLGDHCKYFSWYDEEEGTKWQKRALLEAHDEIREKDRVIEQLQKTISPMRSDLANKQKVTEDDENEIVRKFEAFYV